MSILMKPNNNINWVTWFLTLQKLELEVENEWQSQDEHNSLIYYHQQSMYN
jgi:hypothetical protein